MAKPADIILASTSNYRDQLLSRLRLGHRVVAPDFDERSQAPSEPEAWAVALALGKALSVSRLYPDAWVIGSDQLALLGGQRLGKSGSYQRAFEQLQASSGRCVQFLTSVVLVRDSVTLEQAVDIVEVQFRDLTDTEIDNYLRLETPYDCAGSFKCEGLGISLFESIRSNDPTSLVGLPLIAVAKMLRKRGVCPL